MVLNTGRVRQLLKAFDFQSLFTEQLGWDNDPSKPFPVTIDGTEWKLTPIAQKRGMVAFHCPTPVVSALPDHSLRRKIEKQVARSVHEHFIVFTDSARTTQIWQWVRRESGRPTASREHTYQVTQQGDALIQKLQALAFTLDEEEKITLVDSVGRTKAAFDVEPVTKRFYDEFKKQHSAFLKFIEGITEGTDREWYASVMLNRLMFVYFMQRKGFLNGEMHYLRNRLNQMKADGVDKFHSFYRYFLLRLFHEGLGSTERSPELEKLIGRIPYLNGGLFDIHELERADRYGTDIEIPDGAFEHIFDYFDDYQWHLDERPLKNDKEINPDVLGYIFEKYINQKQMGAYYTKEDITEYISKNTVIPFLLDAARKECRIAFDNPGGPTVWDMLNNDPDRYIYPAVRHGVTWDYQPAQPQQGKPLEKPYELPDDIAAGVNPPTLNDPVGDGPVKTLELRKGWNRSAPSEYALPTETWREVVARRARYEEVRAKLSAGEVCNVNDLITLNLDLRQFAQDVIENCEGPDLLRAIWHAIEKVTVLDPTCGSGAFLFAALNILEPLYQACLERMEAFVTDLDRSGEKHHPERFSDFRKVLKNVEAHPNRDYFILKSIILNNLYGVDIMEEAVEICKLRLFLKLAAQVEPDSKHKNIGIEPLPDIDFNIRAGNTLVGFATYEEAERAVKSRQDFEGAWDKISTTNDDLQLAFKAFRERQIEGDGSVPSEHKEKLRKRLSALDEELNQYLAGEFGVKVSDHEAYERWLKSHQPFHWFVEFNATMTDGGFDVIIGNPPYLEYSKVDKYRVKNYRTESCDNLYALTVERCVELRGPETRMGLIVPISIACSGAFNPLRQVLRSSKFTLWLSHFSNRPGQLFSGAQNRLTIMLTSSKLKVSNSYSTRYHRWDSRNGERHALLSTLHYQEIDSSVPTFHGLLPKLGQPVAASVLKKFMHGRSIGAYANKLGNANLYWVRVPGYFCIFMCEAPMARPVTGGTARVRGEVNKISFTDESVRNAMHSILNSSTFYQFFCTYTDTRHINPSDVSQFPFDLERVTIPKQRQLVELSSELAEGFLTNTLQRKKSGLLIDSIDAKPCKPVLDAIDGVIAWHYGFDEQELDFIINYDFKYRMGRDGGDEEE